MNASNPQFRNDDNTPNLDLLTQTFQRSGPSVAGGISWLDNIRFCKWPRQWADGKKHGIENDPKSEAFPFEGASDVRPMVVDDIINERAAMLQVAFWAAQTQPGSVGTDDDAGAYGVALWEHLMFSERMFPALIREVELSAQYIEHYGWTMLAPRWKRAMGIKRHKVYLQGLAGSAQAQQQQQLQNVQQLNPQLQQAPAPGQTPPGMGPDANALSQPSMPPSDPDPNAINLGQLLQAIADPSREEEAILIAQQWYDGFIASQLPEDMQDQAPTLSKKQVRKVIVNLRTTGEAVIPLPYLSRNEPEIAALKPWDEVYLPPELTTANELVYQIERLHEYDLRGRIITDGYDKEWVEKAVKFKGAQSATPMETRGGPVGLGGLLGGNTTTPIISAQPTLDSTLIEIMHAVYHGMDEDGIPAVYCTTFHRQITGEYAKDDLVEGSDGELPYAAGVREWRCRSITASRGVAERAHTQQNIVKGLLDGVLDRTSMTTMPPLNVYESPTGQKYRFGPAVKNYVKPGKEPAFMQMPTGQGQEEASATLTMIRGMIDNSYALMSGDVSQPRLQMSQSSSTGKFLAMWNQAKQMVLNLCREHMDDQEFADITGAPPGWLDAHREDTSCLACQFAFDVRDLDPELMLKRIESMNQIALPNDVMGVINRGKWAAYMVRAFLGSRAAKDIVVSQPDASAALREKAEAQVLKMFAGNAPTFLDKNDPTAAGLLQFTLQNVLSNPVYLKALNDEALAAVSQAAKQPVQQLAMMANQGGGRHPDDRFSGLLIQWLQNLQFIGVTQPQNRQIGRMGVKPDAGAQTS